ncbi:MAG: DUF885 family protein [Myxococcota bacterium]
MPTLRQEFFDGYIGFHPEEATTLGIAEGANRLRDHGPDALARERSWFEAMRARLDQLDDGALTLDERLDALCVRRLVEFHLHTMPWLYHTIDWSLYPYAMLEVQRLHAATDDERAAMDQRAGEVPRFLAQQRHNVEQAIASGLCVPDTTLRDFFVATQIPPAIEALRSAGYEPAASAYETHATWLMGIDTADAGSIGPDELRVRLRVMFGIDEDPHDLVAAAREDLTEIHDAMIAVAAKVAPQRKITTLPDARALAWQMQEATVETDDVVGFFSAYVARTRRFVVERGLFDVPDDYQMGVDILPPSMALAVPAGNWPAPLRARDKLGHFLVAADPTLHLSAWAADLAVHEGLPGHHLQSWIWQRRFGDDPSPVRFLVVHDHVAIPRHYWGPMLNIEGWAVYAEELMRRAGFFTEAEELFVLMAHAVRAARVVADLSLAAGEMTATEVQTLMMEQACMAERSAALEARRYAQAPLQASTYHLGRKAIESLAAEWSDPAAFHDDFLGLGPIDPRALARLR